MIRSVSVPSAAAVSSELCSAGSGLPSASNLSSQNGCPAMSVMVSLLQAALPVCRVQPVRSVVRGSVGSLRLQGPHQVEQPGALEIGAAPERDGRAGED